MTHLLNPRRAAAASLLATALAAAHADTVDARCDIYPKGSDHTTQVLTCTFSQRQGYILIRRADGVVHDLSPVGQTSGNFRDHGGLPAHAAGPASAAWAAAPTAMPAAAAPSVPFDQTLNLLGVGFRVTSANGGSTSELKIVPSGLAIDNTPVVRTLDGQVVRAEVADLNADGSPEIYVFVRSAGSGSYGSLMAFNANERKSLSDIFIAPLTEHPTAAKGYSGHDEFAVVERRLVRRFPVYRPGDTNAAPKGGMRQLQYRLTHVEASWRLEIDRVVEF
jgi:hypothetical protein